MLAVVGVKGRISCKGEEAERVFSACCVLVCDKTLLPYLQGTDWCDMCSQVGHLRLRRLECVGIDYRECTVARLAARDLTLRSIDRVS